MQIHVSTHSRTEFIDITDQIQKEIDNSGIACGMCLVFVPHTTAAVMINENADPNVPMDMEIILDRLIPWKGGYRHMEGNSAAHMKTMLVGSSELVPIENGKLFLGTWQSIFFCEFDGPRKRQVFLQFIANSEKE